VVTPTFNRTAELERAIKSVDEQTFKDWVHVIVNDACPKTTAYLKHLAKSDPKFASGQRIVITLPINTNDLGATPLNEGLKGMTEDYWCVLADDNIYLPDHLNHLYQDLDRFKDIYDATYSNTILKHKNIPEFYLVRSSNVPAWNYIDLGEPLYKRELYEKYGPYKYENYARAAELFGERAGDRYSYDWHFMQKCIEGGAKFQHLDYDPSFIFFLDNKNLDPERYHQKIMIGASPAGNGGCAWYRLKYPLNLIHSNKEADVKYWSRSLGDWGTQTFSMMADVLVFQAPGKDEMAKEIVKLRNLGKICVIEMDDNIFRTDWDNFKYREFGFTDAGFSFKSKEACVRNIRYFIDGMAKDGIKCPHLEARIREIQSGPESDEYTFEAYKDGWNGFDITRNLDNLRQIQNCLRAADAVTCTTPKLAETLKMFNDNTYVLPNCIDLNIWRDDLKFQGDGKTRIFWSGGCAHYLDLLPVREMLLDICEEYPNVILSMMGYAPAAFLKGFPKNQIETYPWSDFNEHPYRVHRARPDIGIIPLRQSDFADCKSPIKFLELAALGVPCVVSDSIVYTPVVKDCVNGLLFSSPQTFKGAVERLIVDKEMRVQLGAAARQTAEQYDVNKRYGEWLNLYEYLWLRRNFGNPTKNTLYPCLLEKWEKKAGRKINTIKQLEAVWNTRDQTTAPSVAEAPPHGLITLC
jgi:glycosyltransferase involved in cell wall biosynthesis